MMDMEYTDYYLKHPHYTEEEGYVYDDMEYLIDHPLNDSPGWRMPRNIVRHNLELQMKQKRQSEARKAAEKLASYDGVNVHMWEEGIQLPPGVYTERFFGSSANITNCMNQFHKILHQRYNDQAKVLNTNAVQLNNGTCMFVTFQIFDS